LEPKTCAVDAEIRGDSRILRIGRGWLTWFHSCRDRHLDASGKPAFRVEVFLDRELAGMNSGKAIDGADRTELQQNVTRFLRDQQRSKLDGARLITEIVQEGSQNHFLGGLEPCELDSKPQRRFSPWSVLQA
jgi:hypothetical protein